VLRGRALVAGPVSALHLAGRTHRHSPDSPACGVRRGRCVRDLVQVTCRRCQQALRRADPDFRARVRNAVLIGAEDLDAGWAQGQQPQG
jgi:hypothetical protein